MSATASIGEARTVWLKPAEIARELGIAYTSVLAYIHNGELRAYGFGANGGKPYRVRQTDYLAFLESRTVAAADGAAFSDARQETAQPLDAPTPEGAPLRRTRRSGTADQRRGGGRRLKPKPLISLS